MKFSYVLAGFGVLVFVLLVSGCTSTTPQVQTQQIQTSTYTPTVSLSPTPTSVPFPNALALNQYDQFGSGENQGTGTVYGYKVLSNYNWTSPQFNSNPYQEVAGGQNVQNGYTTVTPHEGNTFLFVFVRFLNTGTNVINAPSAAQFYVYSNGTSYTQSSINAPQVTITPVIGSQYANLAGTSGGVVQPGQSNGLDGYLIYEIPSSFSPNTTYVTLDYENQPEWVLG